MLRNLDADFASLAINSVDYSNYFFDCRDLLTQNTSLLVYHIEIHTSYLRTDFDSIRTDRLVFYWNGYKIYLRDLLA